MVARHLQPPRPSNPGQTTPPFWLMFPLGITTHILLYEMLPHLVDTLARAAGLPRQASPLCRLCQFRWPLSILAPSATGRYFTQARGTVARHPYPVERTRCRPRAWGLQTLVWDSQRPPSYSPRWLPSPRTRPHRPEPGRHPTEHRGTVARHPYPVGRTRCLPCNLLGRPERRCNHRPTPWRPRCGLRARRAPGRHPQQRRGRGPGRLPHGQVTETPRHLSHPCRRDSHTDA